MHTTPYREPSYQQLELPDRMPTMGDLRKLNEWCDRMEQRLCMQPDDWRSCIGRQAKLGLAKISARKPR